MKVSLKRVAVIDDGAFGVLLIDGWPRFVTLERTCDNNRVKIPVGSWSCTRTTYYKHGYETYEIHVPNHTRILFHKGNVETDSEGCVIVGEKFGELAGKPAILQSTSAFAAFTKHLGGIDRFTLDVA